MATIYGAGSQGEGVADLQAFLYRWSKATGGKVPMLSITGIMDAATIAALKAWQTLQKIPATGVWDTGTFNKAVAVTSYLAGHKTSDPFAGGYQANSLADDRAWFVQQFQALHNKPPTQSELDYYLTKMQTGTSRSDVMRSIERRYPEDTVNRVYQEILGRDPTDAERAQWVAQLTGSQTTQAAFRSYLASTPEALTRPKTTEPAEGAEDARAVMDQMLDSLDLGGLKDWAWEQIQAGHSATRIMQDLRETPAYKTRFAGLVERVANGLPAMTEQEYLAYEEGAEQLFRANGLPAVFRRRDAYAELIAGNVSLSELSERIQDGFVRVNSAPVEVRDKYAEWFGPSGDASLAAFFLDPERALPELRKQIATAEVGGIGQQFNLDFAYDRARQIAEAGVDADIARQGFSQLGQLDPLFKETVSETQDLTAEEQGADAVFNLGGTGANELERRSRERSAATAGGGGAAIGSAGTGLGSAD